MKERRQETGKLQEIGTALGPNHLDEELDLGERGVRPSELVPFLSCCFKAREDVS